MISKEPWPYKKRDHISSAWKGLEEYMIPIIKHFKINPKTALEFGVDHGYSSDIFGQLFEKVIGVDMFEGDPHIRHKQGEEFYQTVKNSFKDSNVTILKSSFEDYISKDNNVYDLIHIDIVHLYEPTFKCAEWAIQHSNVVILHDTMSFPEIYKVCVDLSNKNKINFFNIPEHHGLGILFKDIK